jgi:hypothetical protein
MAHWTPESFIGQLFTLTMKAFEALDAEKKEAYARDIRGLLERFNRSGDATVLVPSEYLEVVAVRG